MISIIYHKNFKKTFKKMKIGEQKAFEGRLNLFTISPTAPVLNNHSLHGRYIGYRSINITGDLRAIFEILNENLALFIVVDTHSNLYK